MRKKPQKNANKKTPGKKPGVISKKEKEYRNAKRRRETISKNVKKLLSLPPDEKVKTYYYVKKGKKTIRLYKESTANFFINNYLNQSTKESGIMAKKKKPVKRKKMQVESTEGFKLSFSAWQRKDILKEVEERTGVTTLINNDTGEIFKKESELSLFIIDLAGELEQLTSNETLTLTVSKKIISYTKNKAGYDLEEEEGDF